MKMFRQIGSALVQARVGVIALLAVVARLFSPFSFAKVGALVAVFLSMVWSASAQVTNTPSGVSTTITSATGAAFDTAIGIAVTVMAIGAVIMFVKKGLRGRM